MMKIKDVAREAGVSIASVSRVLSGTRPVSQATKTAVLAAAGKLGYRTNYLASALRSQSTRTLGMVVPRIANPYFIDLVQAVEERAQVQGYEVFLCDSADDVDIEARRVRALLSRQVEGIIIIPCDETGSAEVAREALRDVPVVSLDRTVQGVPMDCVCLDNRAGIIAVIDHLIGNGRRRLTFAGARQTVSTARERMETYRDYMSESDPASADRVLLGEFTVEWGERAAERILANRPFPDAVVCGNDLIAAGVIRTLRAHALDVPGDIAVTGFDDIELCRFIEPAITTVRQPLGDIGAAGMGHLFDRIDGNVRPAELIRMMPRLVVRESSA